MPIPDYQTLMLPVLTASAAGEFRIGELVERLADQLSLSLDERAQLVPSGKQTLLSNRVHWAKTYATRAFSYYGSRPPSAYFASYSR
jgi:restriction system protein